jgi:hypothetical protein
MNKHIGAISIVGDAYCYGLAVDGKQVVYLNLAGPATSVEAVWARLAQGKSIMMNVEGRGYYEFRNYDERGLKRLESKIEGLGVYHLMLLHPQIAQTIYAEHGVTYQMWIENTPQCLAKFGAHIEALVDLPIFPEWHGLLYDLGRAQRLVTTVYSSFGGAEFRKINLDKAEWEAQISKALQAGRLKFPS